MLDAILKRMMSDRQELEAARERGLERPFWRAWAQRRREAREAREVHALLESIEREIQETAPTRGRKGCTMFTTQIDEGRKILRGSAGGWDVLVVVGVPGEYGAYPQGKVFLRVEGGAAPHLDRCGQDTGGDCFTSLGGSVAEALANLLTNRPARRAAGNFRAACAAAGEVLTT